MDEIKEQPISGHVQADSRGRLALGRFGITALSYFSVSVSDGILILTPVEVAR